MAIDIGKIRNVGVVDPAEVRDPAPVVIAEAIEPAQRMARERPRRHYGDARVEGEDGEGFEDSGAQGQVKTLRFAREAARRFG